MENAMNDELHNYYNLLGLSPGASSEELKTAHRDLAKVWHPDRFPHDPRLQEKAQEKLKEINRAYDRLRSGNARRQTEPSTRERHAPPTPSHYDQDAQTNTQTVSVRMAQRIGWQLIVAPVLIFAVAFLVTSRSLPRPGGEKTRARNRRSSKTKIRLIRGANNPAVVSILLGTNCHQARMRSRLSLID